MFPETFVQYIVDRLKEVHGIKAIVLGGSWASGAQDASSDLDLGLYYHEDDPLDIAHITRIAGELNDTPKLYLTGLSEWGRWVNGGAWLTIKGRRVDFLYKNLDFMAKILDDCSHGKIELDFYQQPPYGFYSYMYFAEIKQSVVLYDPQGAFQALHSKISGYPELLKRAIINIFTWDAEFTLENARKPARRGDTYVVSGCLTRIVSDLTQTLYALNETFFLSQKRMHRDVAGFAIKPPDFSVRVDGLLGNMGCDPPMLEATLSVAQSLVGDVVKLCGELYTPRFK